MRIVFHGENAASFSHGFAGLVGDKAEIQLLPDHLEAGADQRAYADAEVIVGVKFDASLPQPAGLKLFHGSRFTLRSGRDDPCFYRSLRWKSVSRRPSPRPRPRIPAG